MLYETWDPIYEEIIEDMGYSRSSDEASARLLRSVMINGDLMDDDELASYIGDTAIIIGGAAFDVKDIPEGTLIATGSSIPSLLSEGLVPDIIVTDLDGDMESQKIASKAGSVTVMHAHGDNADAVMQHAKDFKGKIVLTTQSSPDNVIYNFGGFTDGDRAVCMAAHLGARDIVLLGFDLEEPIEKEGSDAGRKRKKLQWAKRIIHSVDAEIRFI